MQEIQLAPVERTPSTGFMSIFSTISENCLPSAPMRMDRDGQNAGHRTETEGDDEDQREDDIGNGAAEFQQALDDEAQPGRGRGVFRGEKIEHESRAPRPTSVPT